MNISIELSTQFMLFWQEEIKTKEKILIFFLIFYLNCLNDKERMLKLSIYKIYIYIYIIFFQFGNLDTHLF